jgi:hypothetical protein
MFAFIPVTWQVYLPELAEQYRLLLALVDAAPALAEIETTSLGG